MMLLDWKRQEKYVGFGLVMFASSAMNNLFVSYYLDLFMNVVELDATAFFVGQTVFMIWNALNDPLFGWISDHMKFEHGRDGEDVTMMSVAVSRRLHVIRYAGMLWGLAFILVWIPPISVASWWYSCLHFTLALCFYDGMLTMVEVNHAALLADISTSVSERAKLNAYSAVCAGIGSLSSFFGHAYWSRDGSRLASFRWMTICVGVTCGFIFQIACKAMSRGISVSITASGPTATMYDQDKASPKCAACGPGSSTPQIESCTNESHDQHNPNLHRRVGENKLDPYATIKANQHHSQQQQQPHETRFRELVTFVLDLLKQPNFWLFQGLYFIQAFDCTFEKNHFTIFLDGLAGDVLSKPFRGSILSASFVLPWIGTVLITPLIQKHGLYDVVQGIFATRIVWCGFSYLFGHLFPSWFAAWFLLSNRVMSEAVCRICPLIITDLVDEDRFIHRRKETMSASIVGASTLLGKCSQSLAPMFGFMILQQNDSSLSLWSDTYKLSMLSLLILVPLLCVLVQVCLWLVFSLKGPYLKRVKDFNKKESKSFINDP